MNIDRVISVCALIVATAALALSLGIGRTNPFGKPLSDYDLSNPQAALLSVRDMLQTENIRAGAGYFVRLMSTGESEDRISFFSEDVTDLKFVNTFEVKDSGYDTNNGKVVSLVQYKIKGIEYRQAFYFIRNKGGFYLGGDYILPLESMRTEADKRYNAMIEKFKQTGKVD
jgi:hypothetical protein